MHPFHVLKLSVALFSLVCAMPLGRGWDPTRGLTDEQLRQIAQRRQVDEIENEIERLGRVQAKQGEAIKELKRIGDGLNEALDFIEYRQRRQKGGDGASSSRPSGTGAK